MKLLGRRKDEKDEKGEDAASDADGAESAAESAGASDSVPSSSRGSQTAPKGRPTPSRSAARRKGPVAPAPMTAAEARARKKSLAGPKLSREERKVNSAERRAAMNERRERMMAGDERYLLARDQGQVRRFVRNVVDARRNALGLFMPSALVLLFAMFTGPRLALYVQPAMMILMAVMLLDGLILGRKVAKRVDEKFPEDTESRLKLALYAVSRASQMRRMRAPRPQVKHGASVE